MQTWLLRHVKPINTRRDYESALKILDKIFDAKRGTTEGNVSEVLSILIERYENRHFPIDAPSPVEAIKFRMEQRGLSPADLVGVLGSRGRVSEILHGKRRLSKKMIQKLQKKLQIPADLLLE